MARRIPNITPVGRLIFPAHRLGIQNVTSMEIDPDIAEQARANLAKLTARSPSSPVMGHTATRPTHPTIGSSPPRQYSLDTCRTSGYGKPSRGSHPDPMGTSFLNGELVSLIAQPDGTAVGSIVEAVAFMRLRSQRTPLGAARLGEMVERSTSAVESVTSLCPDEITSDADGEFTVG